MKINSIASAISLNKAQTRNLQPLKPQVNLIQNYYKDPNQMFQVYFGRDLVTAQMFPSSKNFADTVNENYFQLPPNCTPDQFQLDAGSALNQNKDVLVEAPTGTGKTAIAHYVATKNMHEGKTTFYTTPLKALSNQKLLEFRKVYGDENVGILTGDRRENVEAPIVIMTTEVYRNMALSHRYGAEVPIMDNLGTVIFDEFHYLGDPERGPVWEESLMYTPTDVQTLELSATIGNPKELSSWINNLDGNNAHLVSIPEEARHVPLQFDVLQTASHKAEEKKLQKKLKRMGYIAPDAEVGYSPKPNLSDFKFAVNKLAKKEQLPAIFFVFSRKFSRELVKYFANEGDDLTTADEKKEIKKIVDEHKSKNYIGSDLEYDALEKGYAIHNAGIMPQQKELIEELFQKKLLKVVVATETLAAGINMPAKTVVISAPYKPSDDNDDENGVRLLTANEFKQMSGRAGRRGIDEIGFVYTMPTDRRTEMEFANLEAFSCNPIESKYDPDYGFLAGYYKHNDNENNLEEIYSNSFYAHSNDAMEKDAKIDELLDVSARRKNVLLQRGFLKKDSTAGVETTLKGDMASTVRGYDALTLVDMIANKEFAGMEAPALAMVAAAIANPALPNEDAINKGADLSHILDESLESVDTVHYNLRRSVSYLLENFGKRLSDFESYDEMLEFANSIKKPEIPQETIKLQLEAIEEMQAKFDVIDSKSSAYKLKDIYEGLQKGETIPTQAMQDALEVVENFKSKSKAKTLNAVVANLEAEIEDEMSDVKGNKAKDRQAKIIAQLQAELDYAKMMQYLDERLIDEIGNNHAFKKNNSPVELQQEYVRLSDLYARSTKKDTLISSVEGLQSIEEYKEKYNLEEDKATNLAKVSSTMEKTIDTALEVCRDELKAGLTKDVQTYGRVPAKILYNWALLNEMNTESMTNWQQVLDIIATDGIDEGSVYRNVMQTADLISQIGEIAAVGEKGSDTYSDKEYYRDLKDLCAYTRKLLIQDPVVV